MQTEKLDTKSWCSKQYIQDILRHTEFIEDYLYGKKLHLPLLEQKPETMKDEEWISLNKQVLGLIRLTLTKKVAHNVIKERTIAGLMTTLSDMLRPSAPKRNCHFGPRQHGTGYLGLDFSSGLRRIALARCWMGWVDLNYRLGRNIMLCRHFLARIWMGKMDWDSTRTPLNPLEIPFIHGPLRNGLGMLEQQSPKLVQGLPRERTTCLPLVLEHSSIPLLPDEICCN
ncbi:hypothetical protein DKX38_011510 [Salix brachista]|uniref:Uncharacterized protein n=1 Tax=Salix brachista TaxID=2182728 RepID=A0A5N5LYW4_9ROSI|nr:hypothetical protein DKX38_011510 [Salix brachista]